MWFLWSRLVLDPLENVEEGWSQGLVKVLVVVVEEVHGRGGQVDLSAVDDPLHDEEAEELPPVLLGLFENGYLEHEVQASQVGRYHQIG